MPANKAPGIDKISVRVLKDCLASILPVITSIINASIETYKFATTSKLAEVTPLHKTKTENHELPNNSNQFRFYRFYQKFVKGSYTINSLLICN